MQKDRTTNSAIRVTAALALFCAGVPAVHADAPQPTPSLEHLVRQASYVFVGTVLKLKTVTGTSMPASNHYAIVLVNELVHAREGLADLTGKEITVELNSPRSLKVKQRIVFFARGGPIGETITVREVGHLNTADNTATLGPRVAKIVHQQEDENLERRIMTAELIVAGKIVKIEPATLPGRGTRDDPEWYEVEIEVQSVEKGQLAGRKLSLLFARSIETKPEKTLRLTAELRPIVTKGQEGIWILHKNEVPRLGMSDRYTAADPIDFQAQVQLPRIITLIRAAQGPGGGK
jgi:hypothetical protein